MTPHPFLEGESLNPPLSIVLERHDAKSNGDFRPAASVRFGPELRTGGLLGAATPEDLKTLLWVLSFVTPNGACAPTLMRLAHAMSVSPGKAQVRLERLSRPLWQGQPLLLSTGSGPQLAFSPSPAIVSTREEPPENVLSPPAPAPVSRETTLALSRERYARPRAEVEREIARLNAWPEPPFEFDLSHQDEEIPFHYRPSTDVKERGIVKDQLLRVGLNEEQADDLLRRFDTLRIRRQLSWLHYHPRVRNRTGFLIAAIEDNYEAPASLRFKKPVELDVPVPEQTPELLPGDEEPPPDEQVPPLDMSDLFQ